MEQNLAQDLSQYGCGALSPRYSEALTWAASLHREQRRKPTRVPYLSHLLSVSALVLEDDGSESEAIAALLHDAIEDCGVGIGPYLGELFGDDVLSIVQECSDASPVAGEEKAPWAERKNAYVAHLREASPSALRVSGADKLHNARSTVVDILQSGSWPKSRACPHQNLWYYDSISRIFSSGLRGSRTAQELHRTVGQLYELTPGPHARRNSRMRLPNAFAQARQAVSRHAPGAAMRLAGSAAGRQCGAVRGCISARRTCAEGRTVQS